MAIALAQASAEAGSLCSTSTPEGDAAILGTELRCGTGIREVVRLGDQYGIQVKGAIRWARSPADAIQRQLTLGQHNLLVVGVSPRPGEALFFGQAAPRAHRSAQPAAINSSASGFRWTVSNSQSPV